MDLRSYYKKVRDAEATVKGEEAVLVSLPTSEGGKEGVLTEAPKAVAARMIAESRARLATDEEATGFRERLRAGREQYEKDEAARRVQVVVMPAPIPANDATKQKKDRS